ncbi:bolA-like protein 2 isoform X2 [Onychostruthus taczanowskii]|uniref:bolA-like protein 2 isoform X2 n=1 Tax=Onychostruthus taczanowskii TaxID=356909 RepID=UPI001B8067AE|nr:bolA-like protein 2 isoform X2 [Onychostruthus taczanowskii]
MGELHFRLVTHKPLRNTCFCLVTHNPLQSLPVCLATHNALLRFRLGAHNTPRGAEVTQAEAEMEPPTAEELRLRLQERLQAEHVAR